MAQEQRKPQGVSAASVKPQPKAQIRRRTFTGTREITTDLFKLLPEDVIKHDSGASEKAHPKTHPQEYTRWPHTHPFRTFDKQGKRLEYSVPIAGHFHVIEWTPTDDPEMPANIISVSAPMVMGQRLNDETGLMETVPVPANKYDKHVHDFEYIKTGKITTSNPNPEAAAVVAMVESKTAPVAGVTER